MVNGTCGILTGHAKTYHTPHIGLLKLSILTSRIPVNGPPVIRNISTSLPPMTNEEMERSAPENAQSCQTVVDPC